MYWDREQGELYDWFRGYEDLKTVLSAHVSPAHRILMLGCGNSSKIQPT